MKIKVSFLVKLSKLRLYYIVKLLFLTNNKMETIQNSWFRIYYIQDDSFNDSLIITK